MQVSLAQLKPQPRDVAANLARAEELLAANVAPDLVVLPELFLSGYQLDVGELAGVYRKTHLFGAERDAYVPGDSLSTIRLGARTLGVMICFDMEFPEVARTLAAQEADLLVTISANPVPFALDHDLFARTRALENGLPHVYVNRVGEEDGIVFCGGSLALDPDAGVLAEAGPDEEVVSSADVGEPGRRDGRTRYRELLRDELYVHPAADR